MFSEEELSLHPLFGLLVQSAFIIPLYMLHYHHLSLQGSSCFIYIYNVFSLVPTHTAVPSSHRQTSQHA